MNNNADSLSCIANAEWEKKEHPFPYYYAKGVFTEEFYSAMSNEFQQLLDQGLSEVHCLRRFKRFNEDVYDAYSYVLPPSIKEPLSVFYSQEWLQLMKKFFPDLPLTLDVSSSCHHHRVGSNSGFVHNDFTTTDFFDNTLENEINPWYFHSISGKSASEQTQCSQRRVMRSIMVLYYLNNPAWKEGDGGETCLYTSIDDTEPTIAVPPISNSILVFEVTPRSYHAFRYNPVHERNCIVQSFHSEVDHKLSRHPGFVPVYNNL